MGRAVFLDRDGVINAAVVRKGKPYPPASLDELELLPGVPEALERLRAAGFRLIVVTNQPDVARGTTARTTVEAIHRGLQQGEGERPPLCIDRFQVCYHDDPDGCACRKPAPGMLLAAAREEGIDLAASFMVGDRWRDIEAGRRAGCTTLFIDYGYDEAERSAPDARFRSLAEAADWILNNTRSSE
jgi:D-glycero-D-manno-heptose 1,7-bisphosphate phosphatase